MAAVLGAVRLDHFIKSGSAYFQPSDQGELVDDTIVKLYPLPPRDWWIQRGITTRNESPEDGHHTDGFYVRLMEAVWAWAAGNMAAIKEARVANKLLYGVKLYF